MATADEIRALRASGLSMRRIAEQVGVSYRAVRGAVDPDGYREGLARTNAKHSAAKRAWENEHDRSPCPECGEPMGVGSVRKSYRHCRGCVKRRAEERVAEMIRLRNEEGLANREIAERLGTTLATVATELCRARRRGQVVARDPYMERRREVLAS